VSGLRYPVENLLKLLASGMTYQEILSAYEDLFYPTNLQILFLYLPLFVYSKQR